MGELAPARIVTTHSGVILWKLLWSLLWCFDQWLLVLTWKFPYTSLLSCSESNWVCGIKSHCNVYLPTSAKHLWFPVLGREWVGFANLNEYLRVPVYLSYSLMCNDMILF